MGMSDYQVTRAYETREIRQGRAVGVYVYEFRIGDHGPFTLSFDKETFSPDGAKMALERFAREQRLIIGGGM